MAWRRKLGASVMMFGAATMLGTIAGGTSVGMSYLTSGDLPAPPELIAGIVASALLGGALLMLGGRATYGRWSSSAPIANFIAGVTRTVGVLVALGLGAMLGFVVIDGVEPQDELVALALLSGTAGGLALVLVGGSLRRHSRRHLD